MIDYATPRLTILPRSVGVRPRLLDVRAIQNFASDSPLLTSPASTGSTSVPIRERS